MRTLTIQGVAFPVRLLFVFCLCLSMVAGRALAGAPERERLVPLRGAENFRDLGGYQTASGERAKWGMLYRSAELTYLEEADFERLQQLGIRTVYDFRDNGERENHPTRLTGPWQPTLVSYDYTQDLQVMMGKMREHLDSPEQMKQMIAEHSATFPDEFRGQFAGLFERLVNDPVPLVFHCHEGKDRTGMASALVLTALGVPRETIMQDYLLSNQYRDFAAAQVAAEANRDSDPRMAFYLSIPEATRRCTPRSGICDRRRTARSRFS